MILELRNVKKIYKTRHIVTEALSKVDFAVDKGEFVAVMGESGSGKTTLLNLIATLDQATEGEVLIEGRNVGSLKAKEIAAFRRSRLGFVFQDFNLLDQLNNRDNIFLPLVLSGIRHTVMEQRLKQIQDILGIGGLLDKFPYEISGGQKQRIAIARAIITKPALLLADEPTGALDSASSGAILGLFETLHRQGQTIVMVTHSLSAASHAGRVLFIKDGVVFHELYRGEHEENNAFLERIDQASRMLITKEVRI